MTTDAKPQTTNPRTQELERTDGRIAYDVAGQGPLVLLSPGMGDTRNSYRFLAPMIRDAGYCVASVDLRGHGESSVGWSSYTRTDTAEDLIEVINAVGGPAVIVGQSFSGGAATIAAAKNPGLVKAIVEIDPFTRPPRFSMRALLANSHGYRSGALLLGRFAVTGSVKAWSRYLDVAYPDRKPGDWDAWLDGLEQNLLEPGRAAAARAMLKSKPTDAAEQLPNVRCPALIVMGSSDSDFADPEGEAAAIVDLLPTGLARYAMIEGAGHYPHAQRPERVAEVLLPFLAETRSA